MIEAAAESNPLAREMAAQMQLGVYGTVGKLARQLRAIQRIAPRLKDGGLVRKLSINREPRRRAVGIAAASHSIGAFGGRLYAVGAIAHEVAASGPDISHLQQQSRLDIGDMTNLEADRRLEWKTYWLIYELLEEIFAQSSMPELVILDMPLIMGRDVYAQSLAEEDEETDRELKDEIQKLRDRVESFWARNLERCFPFADGGPVVVTLGRRQFGSLLRLLQGKGQDATPDPLDLSALELIREDWVQILSIGTDRVLAGILPSEHRTAAYNRQGSLDRRAFPKALIEKGSIGFHYLTGARGTPVQVQTLGDASLWHSRGAEVAVDKLAGDLVALTYFDHSKSLPLPLWFAQRAVKVAKQKGPLEFYKRETLRAMRDEQVERTWLSGWEEE
jgi:hypothetical protein